MKIECFITLGPGTTKSAWTFSMMTFGVMALRITIKLFCRVSQNSAITFRMTTFSMRTFSIITLSMII